MQAPKRTMFHHLLKMRLCCQGSKAGGSRKHASGIACCCDQPQASFGKISNVTRDGMNPAGMYCDEWASKWANGHLLVSDSNCFGENVVRWLQIGIES